MKEGTPQELPLYISSRFFFKIFCQLLLLSSLLIIPQDNPKSLTNFSRYCSLPILIPSKKDAFASSDKYLNPNPYESIIGKMESSIALTGQVVGRIEKEESVQTIINETMKEFYDYLEKLKKLS